MHWDGINRPCRSRSVHYIRYGVQDAGTSEGARQVLGRALEKFYPEGCGRLAGRCDRVVCQCSILRSVASAGMVDYSAKRVEISPMQGSGNKRLR